MSSYQVYFILIVDGNMPMYPNISWQKPNDINHNIVQFFVL